MNLDEPLSGHELARRAGVSEPTVRYWRRKHGLVSDDRGRTTPRSLAEFAREHRSHLPKTDAVLRRLSSASPASEEEPPEKNQHDAPQVEIDMEQLRSVARAARNAARDHLDALVLTARSHLAVLELLQRSYTEVDDVLVAFTAPATPND